MGAKKAIPKGWLFHFNLNDPGMQQFLALLAHRLGRPVFFMADRLHRLFDQA